MRTTLSKLQRDLRAWQSGTNPDANARTVGHFRQRLTVRRNPVIIGSDVESNRRSAILSGPDLPGPGDLAETPDVRFTPKVAALAAELENSPVKIYQHVRNDFEFEFLGIACAHALHINLAGLLSHATPPTVLSIFKSVR